MRNEPSREAVNLALELFDTAQRRVRRRENDPTHVIAVALQQLMDARDEARARVTLLSEQIAVTAGDHDVVRR
jgi:hypothetical protein